MKELSITCVYEQGHMIGYGGDQDWFVDEWAQKAGCASVLGSNLYTYYCQYLKMEKQDFVKVMDTMYQIMTPTNHGYPFLYKFARSFCRFMQTQGMSFKPIYKKQARSYEEALSFVIQSIDDDAPVAMLILSHRAKELEEDNWHWICLSGYQQIDEKYRIIFSDCGQRREIDAHILFDTYKDNIWKMVRMKKRP